MKKIISIFAVAVLLLASPGDFFGQGANVKAKDTNGQTALMRAALAGNADSVNAQIAAGADVGAKDKNGETALMKAAVAGNADSVHALIAAGADVKARDRRGQTALAKAVASDVVKLLLDAGAGGGAEKKGGNASITAPQAPNRSADGPVMSQVENDGALMTPPVLRAGEGLTTTPTAGLIAYSLKAAQTRLLASGSGGDWRRHDPELFALAGMTRPEGVVVDRESGDVILIGHAEKDDAPLTLDDFVVALRARMIEGKWPVVSIDPPPAKPWREGDPQTVRFEGGIQNTQFGADLLDADHRLKRMSFGVLPTGVPRLSSLFERWLKRYRTSGARQSQPVRFWFEPVQDRVIVRDDVVQLGPMTVSVFTEILSAGIGGDELALKSNHDEDSDAFAKDISTGFDDVAGMHPTIARVRGLNGIVAVVAGLERIDDAPSMDYWLHKYVVRTVRTLPTVKILQRAETFPDASAVSGLAIEGGVKLRAIALALQSGDVSALRQAVIIARPAPTTLSWRLIVGEWVIPLSPGALAPTAVGPLVAQAEFLSSQNRLDDAIGVLNAVLCVAPEGPPSPGTAAQNNGKSGLALGDCLSVVRAGQEATAYLAPAFATRGGIYFDKRQYARAVQDFDEAIRLDPNDAGVFNSRGNAYYNEGEHDRAIQDYDQAIRLKPNLAAVFFNRGNAYNAKREYDRAIHDYDQAVQLDQTVAEVYYNRGKAFGELGQEASAVADFARARALNPSLPTPDPAPAPYPPPMTASEEARLATLEAKSVKGEREVYIWRPSIGINNEVSRPRWSIRGVLGAADLLSGNAFGDRQTQLLGDGRALGFEIWQVAPENESDVCALESGSVFVNSGDKEGPMRAPIRFKRVQIPGARTSWVFPLSEPDAKSGNLFLIFRPILYPTSDGTLALGGAIGFNNEVGMRTATMRTIPAIVTGTIRFPKNRWTVAGAGFTIKGGGLQFDESGVFLMPGTQYVTKAPLGAVAPPANPVVATTPRAPTPARHSSGATTDEKIALMKAAYAGDLLGIRALIAANADVVNAKADDGRTALHLASLQGHFEVVQALIAAKADVNAKTTQGITALIAALTNDHPKVAQTLIAAKADVNAKTDDGITALYLADGDLAMVQALIAAKADVNARTATGQTALMQAAMENHLEVVQALIAANADVNVENAKGITALILAERMGYEKVVQALKKAGAVGK